MTKYRIKVVEYGDGRKEYISQYKNTSFKEWFLICGDMRFILIFPIILFIISKFFWINLSYKKKSIEEAREIINLSINDDSCKQIKNKIYIKIN